MKKKEAVVIVECIGCHDRSEIGPGEVARGDYPMCKKCFMPVVAVKATQRAVKGNC